MHAHTHAHKTVLLSQQSVDWAKVGGYSWLRSEWSWGQPRCVLQRSTKKLSQTLFLKMCTISVVCFKERLRRLSNFMSKPRLYYIVQCTCTYNMQLCIHSSLSKWPQGRLISWCISSQVLQFPLTLANFGLLLFALGTHKLVHPSVLKLRVCQGDCRWVD